MQGSNCALLIHEFPQPWWSLKENTALSLLQKSEEAPGCSQSYYISLGIIFGSLAGSSQARINSNTFQLLLQLYLVRVLPPGACDNRENVSLIQNYFHQQQCSRIIRIHDLDANGEPNFQSIELSQIIDVDEFFWILEVANSDPLYAITFPLKRSCPNRPNACQCNSQYVRPLTRCCYVTTHPCRPNFFLLIRNLFRRRHYCSRGRCRQSPSLPGSFKRLRGTTSNAAHAALCI